jgi:hypothetical protein
VDVSGSTATALLAGMLLGIPVAALAREEPHGRAADGPPPADLLRLPPGTEPRWRSAPLTSRALIVVLGCCGLLFVVPAIVVGPFGEGVWLLLLAVASLAPAAIFARLRVDVHGHTGVVSRAGEALRIVRGDDTELLITVDDAAEAAATLHTLADHRHAATSSA